VARAAKQGFSLTLLRRRLDGAWRGVRGVRGVWVYDTVIQRGGWSCITVVLQRGYTARPSTRGAVHRRTAGRALRGGSCMVVGVLTIGPQSSG
jgi:hypothetical protein